MVQALNVSLSIRHSMVDAKQPVITLLNTSYLHMQCCQFGFTYPETFCTISIRTTKCSRFSGVLSVMLNNGASVYEVQ